MCHAFLIRRYSHSTQRDSSAIPTTTTNATTTNDTMKNNAISAYQRQGNIRLNDPRLLLVTCVSWMILFVGLLSSTASADPSSSLVSSSQLSSVAFTSRPLYKYSSLSKNNDKYRKNHPMVADVITGASFAGSPFSFVPEASLCCHRYNRSHSCSHSCRSSSFPTTLQTRHKYSLHRPVSSSSCFQYHKQHQQQEEEASVSEHSPKFKTHYNEALLRRIISGRTSSSPRWRRRTKRAAATLGFGNFHDASYSSGSSSSTMMGTSTIGSHPFHRHNHNAVRGNILAFQKGPQDLFSSWTNGKNANTNTHTDLPSSLSSNIYSTMYVSRPVPPLTSIVLKSTASASATTEEDDTASSSSSLLLLSLSSTTRTTTKSNSQYNNNNNNNNNKYNKPTTPKIIRFLRRQKLSPSQHQAAKLDWASKYTSIDVLRQSFGTNRNKFWGDFDTKTTRKLYHTLLPRALLGLYEAELWCPTDLAPLAFEARLAAKKYARERCVLPGRVMAMIYDGYRSWRSWGTWSVEGMSWEQVWNKYETQILEEYMEDNQGHVNLEELQEEITARICVRILERSCITNEHVDKMFLKKDGEDASSRTTRANSNTNNGNSLSRSQKRRRKAERDLARIKNRLERDVEELQLMELQRRQRIHDNSSKIPFLMDILNGFLPSEENGSATLSIRATTTTSNGSSGGEKASTN